MNQCLYLIRAIILPVLLSFGAQVALCQPPTAANPNQQKTADEYLDEGLAFMKAEKFKEAIESLKQAIRLKPDYDGSHWLMGVAYLRLEQYENAVTSLKEAERLNPKNDANFGALGDAYQRMKRYPEAIEAYKAALALSPADKRWQQGMKSAEEEMNAPPNDVVKKETENLWRTNHGPEIANHRVSFQYQAINVSPMEGRPPGSSARDLLYRANVRFLATVAGTPGVTYSAEQNECFYKKQDTATWSTLPCSRNYFVKVDAKVLDTYVGEYQMPKHTEDKPAFVIKLFREGDKLISEALEKRIEFRPISETEFYLKEEDRIVKFVRNDQGQVTHIAWDNLIVKKIK